MQFQKASLADQVANIPSQLNAAYERLFDAQKRVTEAEREIAAYRNLLAGIQLGSELEKEKAAAKVQAEKEEVGVSH